MPTSTTFWALALALVLATLAALVVPLLRSRARGEGPADDDASAAVYRDQMRQLDADVAAGVINADERAVAEAEIVARLGTELSATAQPAAATASRAPWIVAIAIVAIVPAAALVAYLAVGNPQALDAGGARPRMTESEVVSMVERLAERMKSDPSDPQGWLLLGRSWSALQRYQESADAYAEAVKRMPGNADALADWADALGMAQGRKLAGKPTEIIGQALAADPSHPKALALAASAAMERGDNKAAIRYWQSLLALVPPGSEDAQGIAATIVELGGTPTTGAPPAAGASSTAGSSSAPAPAAAARPATPPTEVASARPAAPPTELASARSRITGRVEIAPALAARVPPDATLFVYARAAQGSRMPLAIVRRAARELPFEFALDDSMAMAPGATISSAREVVVEARVSASGSATAAPGDLSGVSAAITPGTSGVRISIDRVVP
jgi:cytochrome c-type biogenesis protein CcmH